MSLRTFVVFGTVLLTASCLDPLGPLDPHSVLGVESIATGGTGACARVKGDRLVCWGEVPPGVATDTAIGYGISLTAREVSLPESFRTLSLSQTPFGSVGCGVGASDQVYCWGDLYIHYDWDLPLGSSITALAGGASARSVSVGVGHLCVTGTDSKVLCFGDYNGGARGTDSVDLGTVDPDADLVPNGLSPSVTALGTAQGRKFGCALTTDSLVACWGSRNAAQVGRATSDSVEACGTFAPPWCQPAPAPVDGGRKYLQLSVSWDAGCATRPTGEVDCWGRRRGAADCSTPGDCIQSPTQVALPGAAREVAVGDNHACALMTTGAVYCWGDNSYGQLGRAGASSAVPVAVSGGYAFSTISAGGYFTCGIVADVDAVACWGANYTGQLGDGTLANSDHPVPVIGAQ